MIDVSVVIPAHNAAADLPACLAALSGQFLPAGRTFEVIVVDDGSTDATAATAEAGRAKVIRQAQAGAGAARNAGIHAAAGRWIAFTDADCIPSRRWLDWLLRSAEEAGPEALGSAGKTLGHGSDTPAARFVDLTGGLDAQAYLRHAVFPFAPSCNVLYRREALLAVGGFEARFLTYEATDLHHRLLAARPGLFTYQERAVVLHRHRAGWWAYFRQQRAYGRGYAQLFLKYPEDLPWSLRREVAVWLRLTGLALVALTPGPADRRLVRRGQFTKQLAQRLGFVEAYWRRPETYRP